MDRLKADFIASLLCSQAAAPVICLSVSRDELWWIAVRWIAPENVITSTGGENRARRGPVRPEPIEKNSLGRMVRAILNLGARPRLEGCTYFVGGHCTPAHAPISASLSVARGRHYCGRR